MLATIWNTVLNYPMLNIVVFLYHFLGDNLGLAIIAVAIISRLALIPLTKKQTEMTQKMSSLKPELDKLQKKYANNPKKLSEEQMKLYKKVGYNPLGCLGTLLPQLIILSVLISVIRAVTSSELDGLYDFVRNYVSNGADFTINTRFLFWDLTQTYNELSGEFGRFSSETLPYLLLAVFVGVTQFFTTKLTNKLQNPDQPKAKKKSEKNVGEQPNMEAMQSQMQNSMLLMFPIMTIFISISAPTALALYWLIQSLMLIVQYFILDFDKSKKGIQNIFTMLKEKFQKK